jgi:hypothetical protein
MTAGFVAGLAGAIVMAAFLYAMTLRGIPTEPVLGTPAWTAAGIGLQLLVGAAWGVGYGYLTGSQPQVLRFPLVSGLAFGIVVYTFMQLLVIIDGGYHRPSAGTTIAGLTGYIVFYGLPVAAITSRMLRRA